MAENGKGKALIDMDSLKETLCAQQRLLQKLYNELDAEREASSTAASEALSMIIRLQGEKAAVKMEAEQYKRMVEEKMFHAEESLAIFEDIMYQREIELAALDYQVQAYRHKLISMGCVEPGNGENKFPENLLQIPPPSPHPPLLSRRNSAPMLLPPKHPNSRKCIDEKERCLTPDRDLVCRDGEDCDSNSDSGKKTDNSSYWDEIRKLDGRVKEIAGISYVNWQCSSRSPSPASETSSGHSYDHLTTTTKGNSSINEMIDTAVDDDETTTAAAECSSSYPRVLDVFEVPQNDKNYDGSKLCTKNQVNMMISHKEDKLQKPDSVSVEIFKESDQNETDSWLKSMIKCSNRGKNLNLITPADVAAIGCNMAIISSSKTSVPEYSNRMHQLNTISEIVEVDREAAGQDQESAAAGAGAAGADSNSSSGRQEELKLLHEITEQLNSIKQELRRLKPRKNSKRNELAFATLMEEMLHFWL